MLAVDVIAPAIRKIRAQTSRGTINLNTNAGRPDLIAQLCDAGLDSVRISVNSFRRACYEAYFRPRGYGFEDVLASMALLAQRKKYISINYLHLPGFTDTSEEQQALTQALTAYRINRIQWRNLNLDPAHYWRSMADVAKPSPPLGMERVIAGLRQTFPSLTHGYFNPPKEKWHVFKSRRKSNSPRSTFSGKGP